MARSGWDGFKERGESEVTTEEVWRMETRRLRKHDLASKMPNSVMCPQFH